MPNNINRSCLFSCVSWLLVVDFVHRHPRMRQSTLYCSKCMGIINARNSPCASLACLIIDRTQHKQTDPNKMVVTTWMPLDAGWKGARFLNIFLGTTLVQHIPRQKAPGSLKFSMLAMQGSRNLTEISPGRASWTLTQRLPRLVHKTYPKTFWLGVRGAQESRPSSSI